jgi:hypothetical protein
MNTGFEPKRQEEQLVTSLINLPCMEINSAGNMWISTNNGNTADTAHIS